VKQKFFALLFILFSCTQTFAQDFYGFVKKADSTSSPVYQANVEITENYKPFKTLKTYFDGAFKFTPAKEQIYTIKISYNGYKDTSYTITTEKNGKLSAQNVTVKLKKDGMRLMGVVKNADENFPIKDATIVLKNVMTRKEDRLTTDIDGKYNLKLEYETNYKVSIDKRSVGIFNKYKDTTFYISTIGFNQPLDYKLDIILDAMLYPSTTVREGYDASKQVLTNVKPVIEVAANSTVEKQPFVVEDKKLKSAQDANAKLLAELEKAKKEIEDLKKKETEQKKSSGGGIVLNKKPKIKEDKNLEVVVIRDEPVTNKNQNDTSLANITMQKEEAEKKAQQIEAEIAKQKTEEANRKAQNLAAQQKAREDSILAAKEEADMRMVTLAMQKQKAKDDSIALAKSKLEKIAQEIAVKKLHEDSLLKAKVEQERVAKELVLKKAKEDSVNKDLAVAKAKFVKDSIQKEIIAARAMFVQDSLAKSKLEIAAKKARQDSIIQAKAEQQRIAKELAVKKAKEDSVSKALAMTRAKFVQDSLIYIKELQAQRKKDEEAIKKREEAERQAIINAEFALKKAKADSVNKVIAMARAKFVQDSVATVKVKQDSISRAKAEQDKIAKELALKKAKEDSVNKAIAVARTRFVKDSIQKEITAARVKFVQDSIAKSKFEIAAKKAKQDSVTQVKAEQEKIANELALKKAKEDSVNKAIAMARVKFVQDSIVKAKGEQVRVVKEKAKEDSINQVVANARKKAVEDSVLKVAMAKNKLNSIDLLDSALASWDGKLGKEKSSVREKFVQDSIAKAKIALEKKLALKKAKEDSIARVQQMAREKFVTDSTAHAQQLRAAKELAAKRAFDDSIIKAKAVLEKQAKELAVKKAKEDSIAKVQLALRNKFAADSIAKAELKIAKQVATQKAFEDSLNKAKLIAEAKAVQDSIVLVKAEKEKIAREGAEQKKQEEEMNRLTAKAMQDSITTAKSEKERKALAESLANAKAELDKVSTELAETKRKAREDSIAKVLVQEKTTKELAEKKKAEELQASADKKAMEDSIAKIQVEKVRMARELAELEQKETQEKRIKEIAEAEQKARGENLSRQQEQEANAKAELELRAKAKEKQKQDSITKAQEALMAQQKADSEAKAQAEAQRVKEEKKQAELNVKVKDKKTVDTTQPDYGNLPAVLFGRNEFVLSAIAKAELKQVSQRLLKEPLLVVNIYAFASQDESNSRQISLQRSDAVLRFFIDNGVPIDQVKSVYYGTSISRNGCVNLNCPEGLQQQNRSVAYQLVPQ